jgi:hypothetical protein
MADVAVVPNPTGSLKYICTVYVVVYFLAGSMLSDNLGDLLSDPLVDMATSEPFFIMKLDAKTTLVKFEHNNSKCLCSRLSDFF